MQLYRLEFVAGRAGQTGILYGQRISLTRDHIKGCQSAFVTSASIVTNHLFFIRHDDQAQSESIVEHKGHLQQQQQYAAIIYLTVTEHHVSLFLEVRYCI